MKPNRKDYIKFLERSCSKNPFLSGYLAERAYNQQVVASVFQVKYQELLKRGRK